MTCIVGLIDEQGNIYMAGDAAVSSGYDLTIKRTPKVFAKGDMVFGIAGYWRLGQVIQYLYEFPEHPADMETEEYIVAYFVEGLREALKEAGHARKEQEQEHHGSSILVGYRGQLFEIEGNYQVTDADTDFYAIGSGAPYALGALYARQEQETEPLLRLKQSLEAAEHYSSGVRRPFSFVMLKTAETEPHTDDAA